MQRELWVVEQKIVNMLDVLQQEILKNIMKVTESLL